MTKTILFIGLKLTNHINWSWWWVLSPMWLPVSIFLALFALIFSVLVIKELFRVARRLAGRNQRG